MDYHKCMHLLYKTHIICKRGSHIHIQPVLPAHFQNAGLEKKQFSLPSLFQATVRIHIWLERWWKKRRRTMTCLLHIRTTTAASPNTKRKERNEDLEEQNTVVYLQIQNKSNYLSNEQRQGIQKSDNLQYNTLGRWVDHLIDQASDGQWVAGLDLDHSKLFIFICKVIKK